MSRDPGLAEPVRDLARNALGHASRIDEDQRRAVGFDQLGKPVIDLVPDLRRHHGFERRGRHFELKVARTVVSTVHDQRALAVRAGADQEMCDLLDRLLRGGESYPLQPPAAKSRQPFE
jgi:hypothetical protein